MGLKTNFIYLFFGSWILLFSSGCEASSCNLSQLGKSFDRKVIVSHTKSFSELEEDSLRDISKHPHVPQVPFGYSNEEWLAFKQKYQQQDCLVYFITPEETWKRLAGLEGYAIIRGNEVIAVFVLKVS
jgi:hypothetical protein